MPLALMLALALAGVDPPPQSDADAAVPTTLDVLVTDERGRAVDTLTAEEFSVVEQGVPLRVHSAHFVRGPSLSTPAVSAPVTAGDLDAVAHVGADARLFGILLDEYHVSPGASADRVREALIRFVREDLGPNDRVALVKPLDSLVTITLTSDRDAVAKAIERFDPRRGDYTPRTPFEREFIAATPSRIEATRAQIVTSSLNALATYFGGFLPSRKTLIFVTEGFAPRGIRLGGPSPVAFSAAASIANRAHVAIYALNPSAEVESDPGGRAAGDADLDAREALRTLASETNGRAATSVRDVGAVLKGAVADAAGYYVLTVSTPEREGDGRWRAVDVRVGRHDLVVRARAGYWAPGERRPLPPGGAPSFLSSFSAQHPRRSSGLIRPWFGLSRGAADTTRVSFVWEPAPRVPGDRATGADPARIVLSVTTLDGASVFNGVVLPANAPASPVGAERSLASFETPAGRLLVQMAIEDAGSRVLDRDVRDLVVGGFPGPVSIGTSEVLRARTEREYQALAANPNATPVAARQFSRTERLLARVPVFAAGLSPHVVARLVSGLGGVMRDLSVAPLPSRPNVYQIDVPLAALAAGAYSIEISARTADGDARDSLLIRVTP